ncbi:MAG: HlyD family efflux transporter periplasmic adaptor subunit [Gammaproteobacteria bacterium]|nr:HlyD family efflux transporter periplasmic adaptor subunit [Gammaproteobacteria bacterium]
MRTPALRRAALPVAILAAAFAVFAWLRAGKPVQAPPEPEAKRWRVEVMAIEPAPRSPALTLYGRVETPTRVRPAAPGPGVVAEVPAREGARFTAGTLLAALDPRDFRTDVARARAELADVEAQLEAERLRVRADREALAKERQLLALAESARDRARRLQDRELGSETALDEADSALRRQELAVTTRRLAVDGADARLAQLEARRARRVAELDAAELALERSRVIAPFDGLVAAVHVAPGDRVQVGAPLLEIYPRDALEVRARVAQRYQQELLDALDAGRPLRAWAEVGGERLALVLRRVAGVADPSGSDAFFGLPPGADARLGTLLELHLVRPPVAGAVAVPYRALYGNGRIYLLRDGRMAGVDVELLGPAAGDEDALALVRDERLAAGDRVIVTHLPNAVDGLPVEPLP